MNVEGVSVLEITKLRNDVDSLYKTVYQGNGSPSLTNQVTSLNERLDAFEEKIMNNLTSMDTEMGLKFDNITAIVNERFNNISSQIAHEFERTKIKEHGAHQLKANLITATIATVSSFLIFFLAHFIELAKH
jgi:uncharacterized protein YqgV (UPF0045/DUF77 family)